MVRKTHSIAVLVAALGVMGAVTSLSVPTSESVIAESDLPVVSPSSSSDTPEYAAGNVSTVIFIPGYGGDNETLSYSATLKDVIQQEGLSAEVKILDTGDGKGDIRQYAADLEELTSASPGPVAWVGYSMGGVIARQAYTPQMFDRVTSVTTWGSPLQGVDLSDFLSKFGADCTLACEQLKPESAVMSNLPSMENTPARWLSVYSTYDNVVPSTASKIVESGTSATVDVSECYTPQNVDHLQITYNSTVMNLTVANILGETPAVC